MDILTFGEALVEIMRTGIDQPLHQPGPFIGPYPSGAPFIFAMQAARLGAKVAAVGSVGEDAFGKCLTYQLTTDGVDIRGVQRLKTHTTGCAFVSYAADGSRDFVFHIAAAGELSPDMLDETLFDGLKALHLMGSTLSIHEQALQTGLHALELAQKVGAKISFDPNLRPQLMPVERAREVFAPFVAAADVLMPTAQEAMLLTGENTLKGALAALLIDERILVMTDGAAGCTVYHGTEVYQVPGFKVREVDPTGAGDCFDAGFLARWLAGDTPAQAARFANACGALSVTVQGPATGAYTFEQVQAFMQEQTHV